MAAVTARMLALWLFAPAALAVLPIDSAADAPLFATSPSGRCDTLIISTRSGSGGTRIDQWDPSRHRKLSTATVTGNVIAMLCIGNHLVCATRRQILVGPASLVAAPTPVWAANRDILRIAPFRKGFLVLVVNNAEAAHPAAGQVYWFSSPGIVKPRRLSLFSIYNFWDVQSGDIDGAGRPVIALCTWSKTRYVRRYARRYFIYGMTNQDTYPRWRGSRLSKPYIEARLVKIGEAREWKLLSVEHVTGDSVCLMLYDWDDFGFFGVGKSVNLKHASLIRNEYGAPLARINSPDGDVLVEAILSHGTLELKHICSLKPGDSVVVGRFGGKDVSALIVPAGGIDSASIHELSTGSQTFRLK